MRNREQRARQTVRERTSRDSARVRAIWIVEDRCVEVRGSWISRVVSIHTMTPRALAEIEGKPVALLWIEGAMSAMRERLAGETSAIVSSALRTSFRADDRATAYLVYTRLYAIRGVLDASARLFHDASDEEAAEWFGTNLPPAYARFERGVWFTSAFPRFGPMCRAAMIVHESVHVFDRRSGDPDVHVSEWDEPRFSQQTTAEALHNPSAYANLAAQIAARAIDWPRVLRYGAGRPHD